MIMALAKPYKDAYLDAGPRANVLSASEVDAETFETPS